MERNSTQATVLAKAVAVVFAIIFAVTAFYVIYKYSTLDRAMSKMPLTDDVRKLASTLFFDRMTALAQLTLALIGAAWALLSVSETRIEVMRLWPPLWCFVIANLAFIASLALYVFGYNFIVSRMFHHLAFDIDADFVQFVNEYQQWLFLEGCIALGATILIGRRQR
jgi:hypothetical protein